MTRVTLDTLIILILFIVDFLGTMVYSDKWAVYNRLSEKGYDRQTVNHSILKQAMEPAPTQLREDGIESRSPCLPSEFAERLLYFHGFSR